MINPGVNQLHDELYKVISRSCLESDLSLAELIGVLELVKIDIVAEHRNRDDEEEANA